MKIRAANQVTPVTSFAVGSVQWLFIGGNLVVLLLAGIHGLAQAQVQTDNHLHGIETSFQGGGELILDRELDIRIPLHLFDYEGVSAEVMKADVPSLQPYDISDYAESVARKWEHGTGQSSDPGFSISNSPASFAPIGADINGDGRVDVRDFAIMQANLGSPGERSDGDLNGDGFVDQGDFALLQASFDNPLVPEPANWLMWAILLPTAGLIIAYFGRRHAQPFGTLAYEERISVV